MSEKSAKRGAKPLAEAEVVGPQLDADKLAERSQALQSLAQAEAQVQALAASIGYAGALDTDSLWSMVEFRQRRSVEDILEMGRGLLLIKEQTAHGAFQEQVAARGIAYRTAARFMSVALKFSKSDTVALLKAAGTQAKVLELTVLDDEDLEALDSGEPVAGITLDDVERMSASELRAALRETREDVKAKDERNQKLTEAVERAKEAESKAKRKWKQATPDEQSATLLAELQAAANSVRLAIAAGSEEAGLSGAVAALVNHAEDNGLGDVRNLAAGLLSGLINDLRLVRDHGAVPMALIQDKRLTEWQQDAEG